MADPHLHPELDAFDRRTVRLYRAGLVTATLGLGAVAFALGAGSTSDPAWVVVWVGTVLCAGNLHLYDKRFRWVLAWLAWSALLVRITTPSMPVEAHPTLVALGHGLILACLSAVILKEWFCFRIPLVRYAPVVMALGVVAQFLGSNLIAAVSLGLGAIAAGAVAVAKLRMPLGHDIGDRGAYQV